MIESGAITFGMGGGPRHRHDDGGENGPAVHRQRFDAVADSYQRARPGYPAELVARLDPPGEALEVGCGTGQLTTDLLARGHRVVAIDLGANLLALARAACPGAEFIHTTFEEADFGTRRFDLVTSATAFHWVDPRVGYRKAAALLRPGGRLALLTHTLVAGPLTDVLGALVKRHAPSLRVIPVRTVEQIRAHVAQADERDISGLLASIDGWPTEAVGADKWFRPPEVTVVDWEQEYSAEQTFDGLKSQGNWPLLAADQASALETAFFRLAANHNGPFPVRRLSFLLSAVRRD